MKRFLLLAMLLKYFENHLDTSKQKIVRFLPYLSPHYLYRHLILFFLLFL